MIRTADIINITPSPICAVKASLNTRIPTSIAVTGSIAPNTEVIVDPIRLIAWISVRFEMIVGMMANKRREPNERMDGIG